MRKYCAITGLIVVVGCAPAVKQAHEPVYRYINLSGGNRILLGEDSAIPS